MDQPLIEDKLKAAFHLEGRTDEKSLTYICKALQRHNLPGFDYLELKMALEEMARMDIKGDVALRSAFASARALGVSKSALLESIARYRDILLREREDFDRALADAMQRKVEARQEEIRSLERRQLDLEQEILRLQSELETARQRIRVSQESIASASGELERSELAFRHTFERVVEAMNLDRETIEQLL
jgi:chromosome segregation ATPase